MRKMNEEEDEETSLKDPKAIGMRLVRNVWFIYHTDICERSLIVNHLTLRCFLLLLIRDSSNDV